MPRHPRFRAASVVALIVAAPLLAFCLAPSAAVAQQAHVSTAAAVRTGTSAMREQTADQQVMQLLNRLAFGPRPGEVAQVRAVGVDRWIEQQLQPEHIDDSAMDAVIAQYPLLNANQADLATQFVRAQRERRQMKRGSGDTASSPLSAQPDPADAAALRQIQRQRGQVVGQVESARIARAVASNRQLLEVMTDFWENHFSVYVRKNPVEAYYLADYDRTIRAHALGSFRDLLGAVAHSPAMLVYLDNAQSRANPGQPTLPPQRGAGVPGAAFRRGMAGGAKKASGLNENYGRELLELHTLGVDGGYTQADVIAAARALTGWSVTLPIRGSGFVFRPEWHDAAAKTFLGQPFPAGRGEDEGERVLDIVARSPATAHFIALKLAQRFVSDSPSAALVDRAARTYLSSKGDIRSVVRSIVTSPEFFATSAYHSKVKSPFEVAVSAARALDARPDTTAATALAIAYLGEPLFGHQAPDGWPETGESWMNTGAILNRINFGMAVAGDRLPGADLVNLPGAADLKNAPRDQQVDAVVAAMLGGAISPETRRILVSGEHPLASSAAATAATAVPSGDMMAARGVGAHANGNKGVNLLGPRQGRAVVAGAPPQLKGLAQVVGLALGSPEFQRR